jgi:hypothetical protein
MLAELHRQKWRDGVGPIGESESSLQAVILGHGVRRRNPLPGERGDVEIRTRSPAGDVRRPSGAVAKNAHGAIVASTQSREHRGHTRAAHCASYTACPAPM